MAIMKATTDIISSITMSPVGSAVMKVILFIETFGIDVFIVFICNIIMCKMSQRPIIFSIIDGMLILIILLCEINEKYPNY